ncbi:Endonuclease/Exonuclease/phosphatase family protein [Corynebacterium kalinowskii]|uniref:Endonuclease/Exonuclease/phosphatase family protein n=1 Tax=Corynebacterium kalinowskii TaxID=2675216 RepID=A0A6B8VAM1_9CORY|nr:ExeM/NucH family extracellular endonuclease [Corynebacterium kalinowskii]QGU01313.1 Endonuclease/Exonuclease/phosphatase family protein [Corynebacterium kalinowskii]
MIIRRHTTALVAAAATIASLTTPVLATPAGDNVVISEAYGGGGNTGAPYSNDFVELYNPTNAPIDLTGFQLEYYSASGNLGNTTELSGTIPALGYFLVQMSAGSNAAQALPSPDLEGTASMGGKAGTVKLTKGGAAIDVLGWGTATIVEGTAAGATDNTTSAQRTAPATDTDNNAADFTIAAPTPKGSGQATTEPTPTPTPEPSPGNVTIAEIQGTGDTSTMVDQTVTTKGFVTAAYPEGGFNGFYLQTGGTGVAKQAGEASDGIFAYQGRDTVVPAVGACVEVSGLVAEFGDAGKSLTQLKNVTVAEATDCGEAIKPVEIDTMPADPALREAYEGMLVLPKGAYTVTNNYNLNTFGSVDLAAGAEAYKQATDLFEPSTDPNSEVQREMARQAAEVVALDDGRSANYMKTDKETPLPYISQAGTIKSLRTGDGVTFQHPVVFDQRYGAWGYQPTAPVTGATAAAELPITWTDSRASVLDVPDTVQGDFSIASFNVLNYFTSLGEDEAGCQFYTDKDGNPISTNYCNVRGAYSTAAFKDQQAKIVAAINKLNVSVLGLEEIENTATVTGDPSRRDEALATLVFELNAAGGNWEFVKSPAKLPGSEDFIRTAFIYDKDKVKPVGDSIIFDAAEFTGVARQPLAQEFASVADDSQTFVAIVNHFKSKGSVAHGDADMGDGQGANANLRVEQSKAVLRELAAQTKWADKPVFIMGDLNSYAKETAVTTLVDGGFTLIDGGSESYQFGGRLGSLDHVLANEAANALIKDAKVWDINADESVAFEYSRRNYNAVDFYAPDVFRSSDHDPIKVGFSFGAPSKPEEPGKDSGSSSSSTGSSSSILALILGAVGIFGGLEYVLRTYFPVQYAQLKQQLFR